MKKFLFAFLLLLLSGSPSLVFANGSTGLVSISDKLLQIISDGAPRLYIYNVVINNGGCAQTTPVLLMDSTMVLSKEIYSMLLTAKATGRKVDLVTSGCWGDFPKVFSVYLGD